MSLATQTLYSEVPSFPSISASVSSISIASVCFTQLRSFSDWEQSHPPSLESSGYSGTA